MPVGGIGAGCICLNGYGGLQDLRDGFRERRGFGQDTGDGILRIQASFRQFARRYIPTHAHQPHDRPIA